MLTRQFKSTDKKNYAPSRSVYYNPTKTLNLLLLTALFFLNLNLAKAQVSLSFHIGTGPRWAPVAYSHTTRYYYFPEYDLYFDALRNGYYYNEGEGWFFTPVLPFGFHEAQLYTTEKVVISYYGQHPYNHFSSHRLRYVERYHPGWRNHGYYRPGKPLRPGRPPIRPDKPHEGYRPGKPQIQPTRPITPDRPQIQLARPVSPVRPQIQPARPVSPGRPGGMNGPSRPGLNGPSRPDRSGSPRSPNPL